MNSNDVDKHTQKKMTPIHLGIISYLHEFSIFNTSLPFAYRLIHFINCSVMRKRFKAVDAMEATNSRMIHTAKR